jgi:hypothetical protein
MNCWEFNKCGREAGGVNVQENGVCPAYPDHGRKCAQIAGTLCGGKVQGTIATKLLNCIECDFFQSMHYDRSYKKNDTISHQSLFSRGGRDFLGNVYGTI